MHPKELGRIVKSAREEKGLSQADLGRAIGVKQQSIDAIERGETRRSKFLPEIIAELGIQPEVVGLPKEARLPQGVLPVADPFADKDFPIYTAAEGGPGEIIRSPDPIDWWPRPIEVQRVTGAYGMYIVGTSMAPEFEEGQVAVVNPNLPHVANKPYLFYAETDHGTVRATVKRLRRQTAEAWHVTQHNPPEGQKPDFTLSKNLWRIAHRIVGRQDPS